MQILSWNINGIRAGAKKGVFDWVKKYSPDILCFQETKAQVDQLGSEITEVKGYTSYWSSAQRKGYSGVAVYTKTVPEQVSYGMGIPKFDNEGRMLILEFKEFVLLNVYFPNGGMGPERLKFKFDFYKAFLKFINQLRAKGKNVIFCGDVNTAHKEIDLARPKANEKHTGFLPKERAWIDKVVEHGYIDTFREFNKEPENYSYWDQKTRARDRNVGWRIDYFFIAPELKSKLKNAFILPEVMGSDHCPVGIEVNV